MNGRPKFSIDQVVDVDSEKMFSPNAVIHGIIECEGRTMYLVHTTAGLKRWVDEADLKEVAPVDLIGDLRNRAANG